MLVVEADGNYVEPVSVDNIDIYSGESYSVLIKTDQNPSENYWVSVSVRGRKPGTRRGLTILNYNANSPLNLPKSPLPVSPAWNDYNYSKAFSNKILARRGSRKPPAHSNRKIFLLNTQNTINGYIKWAINNISLVLPATPYLAAVKNPWMNAIDGEIPEDTYPIDYDVMKPPLNPNATHGSRPYMFELNNVVDVILQNANILWKNDSEIHPWHLHGHDFWVLGYGEGKFTAADNEKLNLENPPLRNTAVIFPYGWTALRFVADNPGVWAFHCHIEPHLHMGMGVVLAVAVNLVDDIPIDAMRCAMPAEIPRHGHRP